MVIRACKAIKEDGSRCQAAPLQDSDFCLFHSPDHAKEAAEARRLGGLRRRKEKTVAGAYDLDGLDDVPKIRRLLEIAVLDTLSLENPVARSRTLAYLGQVALKALEVGEFEARLEALETLDRADAATEVIEREGMITTTKATGAVHVHPLVKVERESRQLFARCWREMGLSWSVELDGRVWD